MSPRSVLVLLLAAAGAAHAADGLALPRAGEVWPQWQARVTVGTTTLVPVALAGRSPMPSGAVLGDVYLDAPGLRLPQALGGLRATGGVMLGPRGLALGGAALPLRGGGSGLAVWNGASAVASADPSADAVPYVGIGYTGLAEKGGWGFTADLGLVAENPGGAARMGRAVFGNSGWESAIRELRLSPVLQVGVRYSF